MALITLNKLALPTGSVLQVVRNYVADSGNIQTSSTSFAASGIQQSITPTASGNLILVDFNSTMTDVTSTDRVGLGKMYFKIGSGSFTAMTGSNNYHLGYFHQAKNRYIGATFAGSYTTTGTDTLTFEPYMKSNNSSSTFRLVHEDASYALTVMEIAQ